MVKWHKRIKKILFIMHKNYIQEKKSIYTKCIL